MTNETLRIIQFSNKTAEDRRLLKQFVEFHWSHYQTIPALCPCSIMSIWASNCWHNRFL